MPCRRISGWVCMLDHSVLSKLLQMLFSRSCAMALLQLLLASTLLCSVASSSSSPIGYGYKLVGLDHLNCNDGVVGHLELIRGTETFGKDIKHLKLVARYQSGGWLQVHISDADSKRYEVPQELLPWDPVDDKVTASRKLLGRKLKVEDSGKLSSEKHQLEFHYVAEPFGFAVVRRSNGEVLFNTSAPDNGLLRSTCKPRN